MSGARTKRIKRLEKIFPSLFAELTEFTNEAHQGATFHVERDSLVSVWFATPFMMTRDADALTESNFEVIRDDLQHISPEGVDVHHFSHWACGWYDRLYIRKDDAAQLRAVQAWINALADYPVADEDHFSELEWNRDHPGTYDGECYCDNDDCSVRKEQVDEDS